MRALGVYKIDSHWMLDTLSHWGVARLLPHVLACFNRQWRNLKLVGRPMCACVIQRQHSGRRLQGRRTRSLVLSMEATSPFNSTTFYPSLLLSVIHSSLLLSLLVRLFSLGPPK